MLLRRDLAGRDDWRDHLEPSVTVDTLPVSWKVERLRSLNVRHSWKRELIFIADVAVLAHDEEAELGVLAKVVNPQP